MSLTAADITDLAHSPQTAGPARRTRPNRRRSRSRGGTLRRIPAYRRGRHGGPPHPHRPGHVFNKVKGHPGARSPSACSPAANAPPCCSARSRSAWLAPHGCPSTPHPAYRHQGNCPLSGSRAPRRRARGLICAASSLRPPIPLRTPGRMSRWASCAERSGNGDEDVTIHRMCLQGPDTLSVWFSPGRHIDVFRAAPRPRAKVSARVRQHRA